MAEQRSYTGSFDNCWKFTGKEFANHQYVAQQLQIDYCFAKPYRS